MRPRRERISYENLTLIGIPKELHEKTIEDFLVFDDEGLIEVKESIREYVKDIHHNFEVNKGLLLYGSNGVGKTFIASVILKEAYMCRFTARRVTFVEYIAQYTLAWGASSPDEKERLQEHFYTYYKAVEFLCLEEVGKEIDSKVSVPILEDLLRYREDRGFVTLICTNLDFNTMQSRYGNSITSLIEGNLFPLMVVGEDRRYDMTKKRWE